MRKEKRRKNHGRRWSEKEIESLERNLNKMKLADIARLLSRSTKSVQHKLQDLGINVMNHNENIIVSELAKIINKHPETIRYWINHRGLPSKKEGYYRKVNPEDFWEWAKEHPESIVFSDIPPNAILPEPEWVQDYRENEPLNTLQVWSEKEEEILTELVIQTRLSYQEMGEKLNRSAHSVRHKVAELDLDPRTKSRRKGKYTKREEDTILRLFYDGASYKDIANQLGRSENAIRTKIQRMSRKILEREKGE